MRASWCKRLRRVTKLPVALGFGISTAEQFAEVGEFADAVVVGSAIVETIERNRGTGGRGGGGVCERAFGCQLSAVSSFKIPEALKDARYGASAS